MGSAVKAIFREVGEVYPSVVSKGAIKRRRRKVLPNLPLRKR